MSDTNLMALRYVAESTWGTTPSAALTTLRHTGESINHQNETVNSAEIIADRQLRDVIRTGTFSQGAVNFELSHRTYDPFMEAALGSTFTADTGLSGAESGTDLLVNGTTKKSFTFEKQFTDLSSEFISFTGARVDTFGLQMQLGQIVTGSFGVIGKKGVPAASTVGTGGPTASSTTAPISVIDIAAITEGGSSLSGCSELSISIANNLRRQGQLGSSDPYGIGYGQIVVTGNLVVYYAGRTLLEKATNFTTSSIQFELQDEDGNTYVFNLPDVKYGSPEIGAPGANQDGFLTMPFTAKYDTTTGKTIRITRTDA